MKNVVDFPDTAAIDDEAAAWLVRLDADEPLSEDERIRMREWLNRSPAHRERLTELAELWEKLNALTELAVPLSSTPTQPGTARRWAPLVGSTGIATLAVTAFLIYSQHFGPPPITESNGLYSSAIGEQRTTQLIDGSEVVLNTNTQIRVDYDEEYRDVRLMQGEALFVVAEDEQRPFRVFAGGGRIEAVGTAFSVYLKDDGVDITVTEGKVALSTVEQTSAAPPAASDSLGRQRSPSPPSTSLGTLRAGQIATLPRLDEPSTNASGMQLRDSRSVQEQELRRRLSWTSGNLRFQREPLEHIIDEISRYTTVKIEFADPALRSIEMMGSFPVGETELMFETLEAYGFEVTYLSANRVRISKAD